MTALKRFQVQQIDCGYDHCVAFCAEDKGADAPPVERVFTWGRGEEGQLGHNDYFSRCVPRSVRTLEARGIRAVHAGGFSSAAIDEAKQVYTWGDSREGQLGHGDETSLNTPAILREPIHEDKAQGDFRGTFRARTLFVGPHYMVAMGLDAQAEKVQDPMNDKVDLDKFAWGCNLQGQLVSLFALAQHVRVMSMHHAARKNERRTL
jgi:alpha-tubulin suppressor-like RCC1 family protein